MSARSTRNTQSVRATPALTNTGVSLVVSATVMALKLGASLGSAAVQSLRQANGNLQLPQSLVASSSAPLAASSGTLQTGAGVGLSGLSQVQSLKLASLGQIASSPLIVDQKQLESQMSAFELAQTPLQVHQAGMALASAIAQSNDRLLVRSPSLTVQEASKEIGFTKIDVVQTSPDLVRINAIEPSGRALVTEIKCQAGQPPKLDSEVVGPNSDKSCLVVLQALDDALARRGVILSENKPHLTAGVPESDIARRWISQRITRRTTTTPPSTTSKTTPRTTPARAKLRN